MLPPLFETAAWEMAIYHEMLIIYFLSRTYSQAIALQAWFCEMLSWNALSLKYTHGTD